MDLLGSIQFEAKFESGNLLLSEKVSQFEYDLLVRPDASTNSCLWFYFCIGNVTLNRPYLFHVIGFTKATCTFRNGQTPLVRSTSRAKWEHIPQRQCWYGLGVQRHRLKTSYPVASFLFQFNRQENYFFAFTYPYTHSMLTKFIGRIRDHKLSFCKVLSLGKTPGGSDMPVIMVSQDIHKLGVLMLETRRSLAGAESSNSTEPETLPPLSTVAPPVIPRERQKRVVLITARVHAGEVPASFVLHGVLESVTNNSPASKFLREHVIFVLVPMLNPDGVAAGNYRVNAAGFDLNRCYDAPNPDTQREALFIRRLFVSMLQTARAESVSGRRRDVQRLYEANPLTKALTKCADSLQLRDMFGLANDDSSDSMPDMVSVGSNGSIGSVAAASVASGLPGGRVLNTISMMLRESQQQSSCSERMSDCAAPSTRDAPCAAGGGGGSNGDLTIGSKKASKSPLTSEEASECFWEPEFEVLHGMQLDYVVDLHSHSGTQGGFTFYNYDSYVFCPFRRHICELAFPTMLGRHCAAFGSIRSDAPNAKQWVMHRDTPGSLRRTFNRISKAMCYDNGPYIYAIEVTNSHGPDPQLSGPTQALTLCQDNDNEDDENVSDPPVKGASSPTNAAARASSAVVDGAALPAAEGRPAAGPRSARAVATAAGQSTSQGIPAGSIAYTPTSWMTIGEKICTTFHDIYSTMYGL